MPSASAMLLSTGISAVAQGPVRSETLRAGAYSLRVDLYTDPPFAGRRFKFDVVVDATAPADLRGLTLTAVALPDITTNATSVRARLNPAPSSGGFQGFVIMPVRGSWFLRFTMAGPGGNNTVDLPLQVAAPTAIPIWLAWTIALAPLLGLLMFAVEQRSYLARLSRSPSAMPDGASAHVGT